MSATEGRSAGRWPWWPALVIAAAAAAFCWPAFLGRVMLPADMCLLMLPWRALQGEFPGFERPHNPMLDPIQQYLPWRIYAVDSLRHGIIPLWNPYAFCGTPFLANLQSTVLYPPNLLFLITGARHGFGASAILHLTLGGMFMYSFLRTLALQRPAALFGALVLMFNGFTVTWLEYPTLSLWVFMWLPAILLCYERSLRSPGSVWPVLCALAVGLQFLGGHFQISAYVMVAFLLYVIVRFIARPAGAPARSGVLLLAAAPAVLGLSLAAGQILPTLELAEHTGRVSHGAGAAVSTALPLSHLVLYLVPNFYGNPVHYNYWGHVEHEAINFLETACYVGILPLLLTAWAVRRWRDAETRYFGALTLLAVLVAVGSPVYLVLYYAVPGFGGLAGLARVLCLAAFGIAGLAALGLDDLLRRGAAARARSVLVSGGVLVGLVVAQLAAIWPALTSGDFGEALPGFSGYLTRQVLVFLALAAAASGLVALRARMRLGRTPFAVLATGLLVLDLFGFGVRFNPFVDAHMAYPETEATRWLQENAGRWRVTSLASQGMDWMAHNSAMVFGLRDIHGSDSLRVRRSFELVAGPQLDQARYPDPDSPLLDVLGVRHLVTERPVPADWRRVEGIGAPIYENPAAMERASVVYAAVPTGDEGALSILRQDSRLLRRLATVPPGTDLGIPSEPKPAQRSVGSPARRSMGSPARHEMDEPHHQVVRLDAEYESLLVLTDSYYPGWRAWVDGERAPIHRADYAFRGVRVPAGQHTVEMRYEPASYRVGMFISLLALAGAVAGAAALCRSSCASAPATASRP